MKILIAEDNSFSRNLLKKTLARAGYEVVAAENGEAAWTILQEDVPPKLALIDWMMPGLSGVELCRRLRSSQKAFPVYVILLTARTGKEDVLEGFSAGADDFITKPFDSGELLARVQVGRRLVEQHALLHCLIDSIPDPIYFKDSRGAYLGCNSAYQQFVGKAESDIIGQTASDVLPVDKALASHMEDLRVLSEGLPLETEGWVVNAAGQKAYHNTIKMPYLESSAGSTGMIGVSRDITRRMLIEQEMKQLAVAVEQSTEMIIITDVSGRILYVNKAFETTTGYTAEEVLGKNPLILKSDEQDSTEYKRFQDTILAGEVWNGKLTSRMKSGNLFDEEIIVYPIRGDDDQVVNYVYISRDITQEMAFEMQLRQTQKMNAIGKLAGGVAHDFNNILTAILGYVALSMSCVEENSKVYSYLHEVVKAGDRATKLIRQILTFSRQEEQIFRPLSLLPIIDDSVGMIQTGLKSDVQIETDIDRGCRPILGDATQIQQILINLCTNAVQAMGEQGGTLTVTLKQVELMGKTLGRKMQELEPGFYCCMTVSDTGCGMTPDTMSRIFEPYFTTKAKGVGTGIGLAIVHGIVRKHRGYITVDSEVGEGTTFNLYFPMILGDAEEERQTIEMAKLEGSGHILYVDDDPAVLALGREILESFGYQVTTATNGQEAWELFQQNPVRFDALITDFSMPKMTGQELINECLKISPDLPVILCSGYMESDENEEDDGEDDTKRLLGNIQFMPKPVDWRELGRSIQKKINARR